MKKILWLLLLLPGIAAGQIYINSYQFAAPAANCGGLPLDSDCAPDAELGLSLRKLRAAQSNDTCIQVRNATTSRTFVIGFVNNYLDTARLKDSCASANCFVRIWYDQSGNGRNAEQTTDANQPQITTSGVIFYKNGTPSLDFDGSNDFMQIPNSATSFNFLHNGTISFVSHVVATDASVAAGQVIVANTNGGGAGRRGIIQNIRSDYKVQTFAHNGDLGTTAYANSTANNTIANNTFIWMAEIDADNATASNRSKIYLNAGSAIQNNTETGGQITANAGSILMISRYTSDSSGGELNGSIKEIIIWDTDQSTIRTDIRNNLNTFYSIY
jgi:hypothetical protein